MQAVRWSRSTIGLSRLFIRRIYASDFVQLFVALLIVANFIVNCLEAQFVGEFLPVFKMIEIIFTSACPSPYMLMQCSDTAWLNALAVSLSVYHYLQGIEAVLRTPHRASHLQS